MTATVRQAAGSLLIVGLSGTELTSLERAWLKLIRPAGIILFRRNIVDAAQTRALLDAAATLCAPNTFRCVDVEGGSVNRLRDALAPIPSAQAVATAATSTANPRLIHQHGELIARAVKAFGFNTTLAPVIDLALPASAKVMAERAPAATPIGVYEYASNFIAGLTAQGVVGCGKHFPGLGAGTLDSHLETPTIDRGWKTLWSEDLLPYRRLCNELHMIMVNHAAYPQTAGKNHPASASNFWITTVLRNKIGYRGIVFSDDLEMGGILKFLPIEEAAITAIRAGMDLLEICHSPELILRAYEALITEAERSTTFRTLLTELSRATARKRKNLFAAGPQRALSTSQFEKLRQRIIDYRETIEGAQPE